MLHRRTLFQLVSLYLLTHGSPAFAQPSPTPQATPALAGPEGVTLCTRRLHSGIALDWNLRLENATETRGGTEHDVVLIFDEPPIAADGTFDQNNISAPRVTVTAMTQESPTQWLIQVQTTDEVGSIAIEIVGLLTSNGDPLEYNSGAFIFLQPADIDQNGYTNEDDLEYLKSIFHSPVTAGNAAADWG